MATQNQTTTATAVRPFRVDMPDEAIADLRRRIGATRFPNKELVADASQVVQLAMLQALARYWSTDYDFQRLASRLNALPQFMTKIDGLDIHFIHVKSRHENALPLVITHGWPGSVIELLEVVGPLTDPTAHGGRAEDAFDLVLPSLPGYGFSGQPTSVGWGAGRIAQAWAELMNGLGYTRRAGGLAARPRRRQLREDLARIPRRTAFGRPDAGQDRRQDHAVLADEHRHLVRAAVLGERTKHCCCHCVRAEAARALAPG